MRILKLVVAILVVGVIRTSAHGDPITFDNGGRTFVWFAGTFPDPGSLFDPTRPPESQPIVTTSTSLFYSAALGGESNSVGADQISTGVGTSILLARNLTSVVVNGPQPGQQTFFRTATIFQVGDTIGPENNYESRAHVGYFGPGLGRHPLIGDRAFVGFVATLADGLPHYGYVEVLYLTGFAPNDVFITMYQPIRWAYESLPNTPILVVPGPGVGAALALGLAAATGRRRR